MLLNIARTLNQLNKYKEFFTVFFPILNQTKTKV